MAKNKIMKKSTYSLMSELKKKKLSLLWPWVNIQIHDIYTILN